MFKSRKRGHTYDYRDLPDESSIRLLRLSKGRFSSELSYSLQVFRLSDVPRYAALSYTRARAVETKSPARDQVQDLKLEDGHLTISENLADFISTLRGRSSGLTYIWIDALSINQQNVKERESQVSLMDKIYSNAAEVWVWLGKSEAGLNSMLWLHGTFLDALHQYIEDSGLDAVGSLRPFGSTLLEKLNLDMSPPKIENMWKDYLTFWKDRRWFSRAWCLQEVTLAKKVVVTVGSNSSLSWIYLLDLAYYVVTLGWHADLNDLEVPDVRPGRSATPFRQLSILRQDRAKLLSSDADLGRIRQYAMGDRDMSIAIGALFHLTEVSSSMSATDPRDNIFSLLGLTRAIWPSRERLPIPISYSIPVSEFFQNTTVLFLQQLGRLIGLSYACGVRAAGTDHPSWAIDFTLETESIGPCFAITGIGQYNTWPPREEEEEELPHVSVAAGVLSVHGAILGSVSHVETLPTPGQLEELVSFLKFYTKLDRMYRATGECRAAAVMRTLNADLHPERSTSTPRAFRRWIGLSVYDMLVKSGDDSLPLVALVDRLSVLDTLDAPGDKDYFPTTSDIRAMAEQYEAAESESNEAISAFFQDVLAQGLTYFDRLYSIVAVGRSIFRTSEGYIGLAPNWIRSGDEVVLLETGRVPFIMRRQTDSEQYKLVGEAYVHGIMGGQAVTSQVEAGRRLIEII